MAIVYNCKYCGKEIIEDKLVYCGRIADFQKWIDNKIDELSEKCECRKLDKKIDTTESVNKNKIQL